MVNKTVITINGLTFGGKAIPLAGFSSTHGIKNWGFIGMPSASVAGKFSID